MTWDIWRCLHRGNAEDEVEEDFLMFLSHAKSLLLEPTKDLSHLEKAWLRFLIGNNPQGLSEKTLRNMHFSNLLLAINYGELRGLYAEEPPEHCQPLPPLPATVLQRYAGPNVKGRYPETPVWLKDGVRKVMKEREKTNEHVGKGETTKNTTKERLLYTSIDCLLALSDSSVSSLNASGKTTRENDGMGERDSVDIVKTTIDEVDGEIDDGTIAGGKEEPKVDDGMKFIASMSFLTEEIHPVVRCAQMETQRGWLDEEADKWEKIVVTLDSVLDRLHGIVLKNLNQLSNINQAALDIHDTARSAGAIRDHRRRQLDEIRDARTWEGIGKSGPRDYSSTERLYDHPSENWFFTESMESKTGRGGAIGSGGRSDEEKTSRGGEMEGGLGDHGDVTNAGNDRGPFAISAENHRAKGNKGILVKASREREVTHGDVNRAMKRRQKRVRFFLETEV